MHRRPGTAARAATMAVLLLAGACSHLPHWSWHRSPAPPPQPVHELTITGTPGTFPQYWKRNTLVVDLSGARGAGNIVLAPAAGTTWPVRIALRVMPGSFGVLEVRAAQRMLLPITADGTQPIDLELTPGLYTAASPQIAVAWGPAAPPAQ